MLSLGCDIEAERLYVVQYICRSAPGFYLFGVRLTASVVGKLIYVASFVAFRFPREGSCTTISVGCPHSLDEKLKQVPDSHLSLTALISTDVPTRQIVQSIFSLVTPSFLFQRCLCARRAWQWSTS
jgi:hypothetical protein